jgi:hypothetical protein
VARTKMHMFEHVHLCAHCTETNNVRRLFMFVLNAHEQDSMKSPVVFGEPVRKRSHRSSAAPIENRSIINETAGIGAETQPRVRADLLKDVEAVSRSQRDGKLGRGVWGVGGHPRGLECHATFPEHRCEKRIYGASAT